LPSIRPGSVQELPADYTVTTRSRNSLLIESATAAVRLVQIAEEAITLLAADPDAAVRVTVEVAAEFPSGAGDSLRRAVSENAASLGFTTKEWE
jgi:hypothetical protein